MQRKHKNAGGVEDNPASTIEPATMLLLDFGLVGLEGVRNKFKKPRIKYES